MVTMRVVQVAVHQVVHMVAVRHGLVAATGAVYVVGGVSGALVLGCAALGIILVDRQYVLVDMIAVHVMQVPVMQVIDVAVVLDGGMPAAGAVLMIMVMMLFAIVHEPLLRSLAGVRLVAGRAGVYWV